jgi:hypothetical protein
MRWLWERAQRARIRIGSRGHPGDGCDNVPHPRGGPRAYLPPGPSVQRLFSILPVLVGLGVLGSAAEARAQACCTGTGTGEFGLVGPCRDAVIATMVGYDRAFGSFDPQGRLRSLGGASVDDVVLTLGGGIRFHHRRLQVHGAVPVRLQHRHFGEQRDTRVLPGDANVTFRWTAVMGGMQGLGASTHRGRLPFFDLLAGSRIPFGRAPEDGQSPLGADVTGMGSWEVYGGAKLAQFITRRHAASLSVVYGYQLARDVPGPQATMDFWPGHSVEVRGSWLVVPSFLWSAGVFSTFRYTSTARLDGQAVPMSATRRLRVGAYATYALALPEWETTVILASDVPADRVGQGIPFATVSLSWIVQRNF